jgi:hypothetical protein
MKQVVISSERTKREAMEIIQRIPVDGRYSVTFREHASKRNLEQNAKMWALLSDISKQVDWYGQKLTPENWKDVFTAALKRSKVVPGIDGGFVVIGAHTSNMSIKLMSELIELMTAFGTEHGVKFSAAEWRGEENVKS